jgi:hypothetical protein
LGRGEVDLAADGEGVQAGVIAHLARRAAVRDDQRRFGHTGSVRGLVGVVEGRLVSVPIDRCLGRIDGQRVEPFPAGV